MLGDEDVWKRIWRATLASLDKHGKLDWSKAFLDGWFVPAKRGSDKVGSTKKGKDTKWRLVIDGNRLPKQRLKNLAHAMRNKIGVTRSSPFSLPSELPGCGFRTFRTFRTLAATLSHPQLPIAPHPFF